VSIKARKIMNGRAYSKRACAFFPKVSFFFSSMNRLLSLRGEIVFTFIIHDFTPFVIGGYPVKTENENFPKKKEKFANWIYNGTVL
jgi:hypothetical protein